MVHISHRKMWVYIWILIPLGLQYREPFALQRKSVVEHGQQGAPHCLAIMVQAREWLVRFDRRICSHLTPFDVPHCRPPAPLSLFLVV